MSEMGTRNLGREVLGMDRLLFVLSMVEGQSPSFDCPCMNDMTASVALIYPHAMAVVYAREHVAAAQMTSRPASVFRVCAIPDAMQRWLRQW